MNRRELIRALAVAGFATTLPLALPYASRRIIRTEWMRDPYTKAQEGWICHHLFLWDDNRTKWVKTYDVKPGAEHTFEADKGWYKERDVERLNKLLA